MDAVEAVRAFNRFHSRFAGLLAPRYMDSALSLTEARVLYEIAQRPAVLAAELGADLGLDAGYLSRLIARFVGAGWVRRGVLRATRAAVR
jgi:DNA-binding MarR family transcriptional regulator